MRDDRNVANGITPETAVALYQRLYSLKFLSTPGGPSVHMQSNTEVLEVRDEAKGALVTARALATGQMGGRALRAFFDVFAAARRGCRNIGRVDNVPGVRGEVQDLRPMKVSAACSRSLTFGAPLRGTAAPD